MNATLRTLSLLVAAILTMSLAIKPPATSAQVIGSLQSTMQIQQYSSSIYDGLENYPGILGPVQTPSGKFRFIAVDNNNSYELVTLGANGGILATSTLPDFSTYQLAVDSRGAIYIGIMTFDDHGGPTNFRLQGYSEAHSKTLDIETNPLSAIAIDSHDIIHLSTNTDAGTIIEKRDLDGTLLGKSQPLSYRGSASVISALSVTPSDTLLATVIQPNTNNPASVLELDTNGTLLRTIVSAIPGQPAYSLSVDKAGSFYLPTILGNDDSDVCAGMHVELHKYDKSGEHIGKIDTSAEKSDGPVCPLYGAGTANAANAFVSQDGDLFIATGDFGGTGLTPTRIAKYSYPNTLAVFAPNHKTTAATLRMPRGAEITKATNNTPEDIAAPRDNNNTYPLGLVNFTAKVKDAQPVQVELLFDTDLQPSQVTPRKYHSNEKTYSDVPGAVVTQSELDGKPALKLSYSINDGGELDEDGVVNGTIVDPVGLAVAEDATASSSATVRAPNTGYAKHSGSNIAIWSLFGGAGIFLSIYLARRPVLSQKHIATSRRNSRR